VDVLLDALTAMCHERLGRHQEAVQSLWRAEHPDGPRPASFAEGAEHYAVAQLFIKEAKGLIETPAATSASALRSSQ
jgi:hypothetical protein